MKQHPIVLCILTFCISKMHGLIIEQVNTEKNSHSAICYTDYLMSEMYIANHKSAQSIPLLQNLAKDYSLSFNAKKSVEHALVRALSKNQRFDEIAKRDPSLLEKSKEMQLLFAEAYISTGKEKEAIALLTKILKKNPGHETATYFFVSFLLNKNRHQEALEILHTFLSHIDEQSRHALFYFIEAKIYSEMKNPAKALEALQRCKKLNPGFEKAYLLEALLQENKGELDSAIQNYRHFIEISGDATLIQKHLIELLYSAKRYEDAYQEVCKMNDSSENYYYDKALLEVKLQKHSQALKTIERVLEKNPLHEKAHILKTTLLIHLKAVDQAFNHIFFWLEKDTTNSSALNMCLSLGNTGISSSTIAQKLEAFYKRTPSRNIAASLATLYFDEKKYDKASYYYNEILERIHDSLLRSKIYYQLAYCHFLAQKMDAVEPFLKKALVTGEVYYSVYNLLAYYYASCKKDLPYALELVEQALKNEKGNSDFLDTKGYILICMGKQKEAAPLLVKALSAAPTNKTILSHVTLAQ